jgi:hypothetical protein
MSHAVWASPLEPSAGASSTRSAGDQDIRIVVRDRGSVKGTVLYEDGGAPPVFAVTVGMVTREFSGSSGGSFSIDVPAGRADLDVGGATFQNKRVPGVDVTERKTTRPGQRDPLR